MRRSQAGRWTGEYLHLQEDEWANNANAFVAQDADDAGTYSVRMAGFDLLSVSVHDFAGHP